MGIEIERKFLVAGTSWRTTDGGRRIRQGYLSVDPERTVRVRVSGDAAWLTIKGPSRGVMRPEFEYSIPLADAHELLEVLCLQPVIDKTRHTLRHGAHIWEVDEFHGHNVGLVLAELTLQTPDETFGRPSWLGDEVSNDPRYFNASLVRHPFTEW